MRLRIVFILLFFLHLLSSCTEEILQPVEPKLVVEGWIDDGGFPVVMLSKVVPASGREVAFDDLKDYVVRWGKVTISDGEREVVLTGRKSDSYFPPYIYTTSKMRGEAGKTYWLKAEYENLLATAQTTIPPRAEIEALVPRREGEKYTIDAVIKDNPDENNYYKLFVRLLGRDSCYLSSTLAVVDDKEYTAPISVPVQLGNSFFYLLEDKSHVLSEKDTFLLKVAQIDSVAYDFWQDYMNNEQIRANPFIRYSAGVRSNIVGGVGYWIGYGATEYLCEPYKHDEPIKINK